MTAIAVFDSLALFEPLFTSRLSPKAVFALASETMLKASIMAPGERGAGAYNGLDVFTAAAMDAVAGQQGYGLFNPTRKRAISDWMFAEFHRVDVLARLRAETERVWAALTRPLLPEYAARLPQTLTVFLTPADPANARVMIHARGLSGFGGTTGLLTVDLFPSAGNLARLPHLLARLCVAQLRLALGHRFETLGDWLAYAAACAVFARSIGIADPDGLTAYRTPEDWEAVLAWVAAESGAAAYSDLRLNIYGTLEPVGLWRIPTPDPAMDGEDVRTIGRQLVCETLGETRAPAIAACLYGDAITGRSGHPGFGLPAYFGWWMGAALADGLTGAALADIPPDAALADGLTDAQAEPPWAWPAARWLRAL
jgi:hypothetical protein